jgi:hypothetical protein
VNHLPYSHLIEMDYNTRQLVIAIDCDRACLIVEKCPCGAATVRPWSAELHALMATEWGDERRVDERARAYVMSLTFDPVAREDLAEREVWPAAVPS